MAGIVHFSNFFRYMESAEHAFFRSFGHSVTLNEMDEMMGLPRVQASCDYRHPLRFEDEMERLPLAVGSPGIHIGNTFHAKCPNAMGTDLPIVWIVNVLALGRFNLKFVSVLQINATVAVTFNFVIVTVTHQHEVNVSLEIGVFFLGDQVMSTPALATVGHQCIAIT